MIYSTAAGATTLESTDFGEGRITVAGSSQTIHYHHKDHLGSIRAITNGSGTTIEQNAYYPFGGRHTFGQSYAQATANRYKFNGKEEQTTGNYNVTLDFMFQVEIEVSKFKTYQRPGIMQRCLKMHGRKLGLPRNSLQRRLGKNVSI